jgi:predicted ATPase with chaperone activity
MSNLSKFHDIRESESPAGPARRPRTLAEIDVPQTTLEDLALKTLFLGGPISVLELSKRIRLSFEVTTELFYRLRAEQLCHVTGMAGNVPNLAITTQGKSRAMDLLSLCQYSGPAPVSLQSYVELVRKQSVRNVSVHSADLARAFSDLVLDDNMLRQFGTALNSGVSIFLYGPPGAGKTVIAHAMSRAIAEVAIWIPYAVEVVGQIITVYDPALHSRIEHHGHSLHDERWVLCHRPSVSVGGELTIEMLDLELNSNTKFYDGPVQMKANNGLLIIDDFGRQRVRPEDLLNRWIVPLDRGIDFLTLAGGRKVEMPFEMLVVFASNMSPSELKDAAFLRRIKTKIKVGAITDAQFGEIFRRVARDNELEVENDTIQELISLIRDSLRQELRACHPKDLVNQVCWAARYEGAQPVLDRGALQRAADAYFLPEF